mgnify:FL=1
MEHWFIGAMITCLFGILVSFANYRLSVRLLVKNPASIQISTPARQILNIGYLAAVYFLAPYTPWDRIAMLVGAVVGVTGGLFYFTYRLVRRMDQMRTDKVKTSPVQADATDKSSATNTDTRDI